MMYSTVEAQLTKAYKNTVYEIVATNKNSIYIDKSESLKGRYVLVKRVVEIRKETLEEVEISGDFFVDQYTMQELFDSKVHHNRLPYLTIYMLKLKPVSLKEAKLFRSKLIRQSVIHSVLTGE